jgi:purine-binding chemotaxis protein CheW
MSQEERSASELQQMLTFVLGGELYGVDILRIQEIRGWSPVTPIPHAPPHVLGVMNLRGSLIAILDLRKAFRLPRADYSTVTAIVVLSVRSDRGPYNVGVVVDQVSEVMDVRSSEVKPPPDLGTSTADHIRGIVTTTNSMIVLLDIDQLVAAYLADSSSGPAYLPQAV